MITVYLTRTPDQPGPEIHQVPDLLTFLRAQFGHWPEGGRILHMPDGQIVTPVTPSDIPRLRMLPGPFAVEVFPRDPTTLAAVAINLAISAALSLVAMALAPSPPHATQRNIRQESPNNGLSDRVNRERINGRIPDIYGTVRATPDLLNTYKVFVNHVEMELAYLCVGRGAYAVSDIRDDTTAIGEIAGASVQVYGPNTSPNSGTPQLTIGNPIDKPVMMTKRSNAVNGQTLQAPNLAHVSFSPMRFESPNLIRSMDAQLDLTELFIAGDVITVTNAAATQGTFQYATPSAVVNGSATGTGAIAFPGDHSASWQAGQIVTITNGTVTWTDSTGGDNDVPYQRSANINGVYELVSASFDGTDTVLELDISANRSAWTTSALTPAGIPDATGTPVLTRPSGTVLYDLSGQYTINTLTASELTLSDPASVNADWNVLQSDYGGVSPTLTVNVQAQAERWVGWFTLEAVQGFSRLIANVVALNGLYADNGKTQYKRNVQVRIEARPVDENGNPTGAVVSHNAIVQGSATSRTTRALTIDLPLGLASRYWQVRMRRVTNADTAFQGTMVEEVKWRDLYAATRIPDDHFGDVTTVQAVTYATDGALAIKERKLNMLVTRKLPQRISGSSFTAELYPTNNVADILSAICLDPYIGNRTAGEVDFDNLYDTAADINAYFGVDVAQFNYTIDSDNLSFEETVNMIAEAVFCTAYRRGSVLRLHFERQTDDSAMLFNHRNKVPGTEQRSTAFGPPEAYDGVELQWVRPSDDSVQTLYLPANRSAVNPKRIETIGIRVPEQAHFHIWRAWNKILYQNETDEFEALPEANLLTLRERILSADNTRGQAQDGEILDAEGLTVYLSQPFEWGAGPYTIFLQNSNGLVESMPVSSGGAAHYALLDRAPNTPLVTEGYNRTGYIIVADTDTRRAQPYLLTEKGAPAPDGTIALSCVNYDDRYYANDGDYRT